MNSTIINNVSTNQKTNKTVNMQCKNKFIVCWCGSLVSFTRFFLYRLNRWFYRLNGFTLVILGPFIVSVWCEPRLRVEDRNLTS